MTESIVLVGGGGHCKACIEVIETTEKKILGILDSKKAYIDILGYPILGDDRSIPELLDKNVRFLITIGQIKNASPRIGVFNKILALGGILISVAASTSIVSRHSEIGAGTIIMHQVIINAAVTIGANCIINNKALVEHDCIIQDHVHISTAAVINGGCRIGARTFIGSNSVIAQGVTITDGVIVGAGSVVLRDIPEPGVYAGNPIRKIIGHE